ncbi:hypothetical protein AHAS_Ahas17G0235800 [Arachis hypogaea]
MVKENLDWQQRTLFGITPKTIDFSSLKEMTGKNLPQVVQVRELGAYKVLLTFDSVLNAEEEYTFKMNSLLQFFHSIWRWDETERFGISEFDLLVKEVGREAFGLNCYEEANEKSDYSCEQRRIVVEREYATMSLRSAWTTEPAVFNDQAVDVVMGELREDRKDKDRLGLESGSDLIKMEHDFHNRDGHVGEGSTANRGGVGGGESSRYSPGSDIEWRDRWVGVISVSMGDFNENVQVEDWRVKDVVRLIAAVVDSKNWIQEDMQLIDFRKKRGREREGPSPLFLAIATPAPRRSVLAAGSHRKGGRRVPLAVSAPPPRLCPRPRLAAPRPHSAETCALASLRRIWPAPSCSSSSSKRWWWSSCSSRPPTVSLPLGDGHVRNLRQGFLEDFLITDDMKQKCYIWGTRLKEDADGNTNEYEEMCTLIGQGEYILMRMHLVSLQAKSDIESQIVSAICLILNQKNEKRFQEQIYCLPPDIVCMALSDHPKGEFVSPKMKKEFRVEAYPSFIPFIDRKKLTSHPYIFAPVCHSGHWWLWLINTRKQKCHILDPLHKKAPSDERKDINKFTGYVFSRLITYAGGEPLQKGENEKKIKSSYVKISGQKTRYKFL